MKSNSCPRIGGCYLLPGYNDKTYETEYPISPILNSECLDRLDSGVDIVCLRSYCYLMFKFYG